MGKVAGLFRRVLPLSLAVSLAACGGMEDEDLWWDADNEEWVSSAHALVDPVIVAEARRPLPFVPFTLKEFQGQKGPLPLTASTVIDVDGEKRTLKEALERLNAFEREMAANGASLRGGLAGIDQPLDPALGINAVKEPLRFSLDVDYGLLNEQHARYLRQYRPQPLAAVSTPEEAVARVWAELDEEEKKEGNGSATDGPGDPAKEKEEPELPPSSTSCVDETVNETGSWGHKWGSSKTFMANIGAQMQVTGTKTYARLQGGGSVGATLFGRGIPVFDGQGSFTARKNKPGTGHAFVSILGNDIFDGSTGTGTSHNGNYSDSVRRAVTIPIARVLGVFSVEARVGVKGKAGLRHSVRTTELSAKGAIVPYFSTSGFARLLVGPKIDLGIVKAKALAGVRGDLTFVDGDLILSGSVTGFDRDHRCMTWNWHYRGTNELTLLKGKLSLTLEVEGCALGKCIGHEWQWKLFSWDGIGPLSTVLFQDGNRRTTTR